MDGPAAGRFVDVVEMRLWIVFDNGDEELDVAHEVDLGYGVNR